MASAEGETDGRAARGARSRAAILDALFELVGEGVLRPTAHQVAGRARVGIRTVFRHFSDMDSLYAELDARLRSEVQSRLETARPSGDIAERLRGLVASRSQLFELISPYKRSTDVLRWQSEFLTRTNREVVREQRADLLRWLPELADAPEDILHAAELATCFEAWNRLRTDQGLGVARTRTAVSRTLVALMKELS